MAPPSAPTWAVTAGRGSAIPGLATGGQAEAMPSSASADCSQGKSLRLSEPELSVEKKWRE